MKMKIKIKTYNEYPRYWMDTTGYSYWWVNEYDNLILNHGVIGIAEEV